MDGAMDKDWLIWIVVGGAGGVSILAMLGVFANIIRYESQLHALRNRVTGLQYNYALRLARLQGQVEDEVLGAFDIVEDAAGTGAGGDGTGVEVPSDEPARAAA
jgi:hypothetical protein